MCCGRVAQIETCVAILYLQCSLGMQCMQPGTFAVLYMFAAHLCGAVDGLACSAPKDIACRLQSWPATIRGIYGDQERYEDTYFAPYKGFYFSGDGAKRDADGYYWITGRVDDVINVSGACLTTGAAYADALCVLAAVWGLHARIWCPSLCYVHQCRLLLLGMREMFAMPCSGAWPKSIRMLQGVSHGA